MSKSKFAPAPFTVGEKVNVPARNQFTVISTSREQDFKARQLGLNVEFKSRRK